MYLCLVGKVSIGKGIERVRKNEEARIKTFLEDKKEKKKSPAVPRLLFHVSFVVGNKQVLLDDTGSLSPFDVLFRPEG